MVRLPHRVYVMWDSDGFTGGPILTAVRLPHRVYVMWDSDASLEAQGL